MSTLEEEKQPLNEQVESMDVSTDSTTPGNEQALEVEPTSLEGDQLEEDETMRDLDELSRISEQLMEDNTQYDLHVNFINLLKKLDAKEQLYEARVAMHDVYPLSEALWLDWIQDTKKEVGDDEQTEIKLLGLYDKAQEDYFSIAIWKDYVEYKLEKFYEIFNDVTELDDTLQEFIEAYREDLLKAVRACTAHVQQSQQVWKLYSQFELDILNKFKTEDQLELVKKMYLTRLSVLHMDYEDTFNAYSSFISNYENSNYEESMVHANKIFAKTKVAAEERDNYEMKLVSSGYALESFYEYIDYEKNTKSMFSLNNVRALYERAVLIYCTDPSLWNDYILFLIENARIQAFLETTCLRSIRNCPWSGVLWSHLARIMESGGHEDTQINDVFDRALSSKAILSNVDELVTVLLAKCDYKRRKIDWEDFDEDDVVDLCVTFEKCLEQINEAFPESGDPYYRIEKYYAFISLKRLGDVNKTREIWEDVVSKHGRDTEAWIHYITFERDQGEYEKCTSLFKKANQKNTNNPARLIDVWTTYEHEMGTLESYEDALVKINTKNKILQHKWAAKHKPKEEDKHLKDRKKKSAHRLAQKHRFKEKKREEHAQTGEASTSDDGVFKKPFLPKREPREGSSLKRKLSDDFDNQRAQEEFKRPKPVRKFFQPRGARGKGALKLGQRGAIGRNTTTATTETSTSAPSTETTTQSTEPKSNDDFRAMLLGNKKK